MDQADMSMAAYDELLQNMPSIGFLSRKKRLIAFAKVTKKAQLMLDDGQLSEENCLYLLSVLARKCGDFQKSAVMAALNLTAFNQGQISDIGFKYANDMRCNLQMIPVDNPNHTTEA